MKFKTVDEYIDSCPKEHQAKLQQLREIIKEAAPKAEEKISYGMPYYGYKGRLAYFGLAKHHIGFYIMTPVIEDHWEEVKEYAKTKVTMQFPLDKELPVSLINKLIKIKYKMNEKVNS
jgi:uncharacterized protein YdhG (YjbR/CyaY superfamily)